MAPSIWQILLIVVIVVLLFGKGRISNIMEDFGKGISAFKKGLGEEGDKKEKPKKQIEDKSALKKENAKKDAPKDTNISQDV